MREGEYEFIHEFKERIDEILGFKRSTIRYIDSPNEPTAVKQTSLAELHRLNITLSNYFDVAPLLSMTYPIIYTETKQLQSQGRNRVYRLDPLIFKILQKPFWVWDQKEHLTLAKESDGQCCLEPCGWPSSLKTVRNSHYSIMKNYCMILF